LTERELGLGLAINKIKSSPLEEYTARKEDGARVQSQMKAVLLSRDFICALTSLCKGIHKQKAVSAPPAFTPVFTLYEAWRLAGRRADAVAALIHTARKLLAKVSMLDAEQKRVETKFHQQTKGRTCPLCQNRLP
jgi:hypothetical protein